MADPKRIAIRRNDRAAFIGTTGSGKTTLAKSLLWGLSHVVILDPKRTFRLPPEWPAGHVTVDGDRKFVERWASTETLIYRPAPNEISKKKIDNIQWFWWWIYHRGNTLVYCDELNLVSDANIIGDGLLACITQGRELGIGTWCATQRPVSIPIICISEAEHVFCFRVRHEEDRVRVAKFTSSELIDSPTGGENAFWYWNDRTQDLRSYKRANVGKVLSR